MDKFTLALWVVLAITPVKSEATTITHVIPLDSAPTSVLFNPTWGFLSSVSLEFKFHSSVIYENLNGGGGTMQPFDIVFSGEAPFAVDNSTELRLRTFSWTQAGHCDGGSSPTAYYSGYSTGSFLQKYSTPDILGFFTSREDDLGLLYHPGWSEGIACSPEQVFDDQMNRYDAFYANAQLGDGIVITYDYEPISEPNTLLLFGVAALSFAALLRRTPVA